MRYGYFSLLVLLPLLSESPAAPQSPSVRYVAITFDDLPKAPDPGNLSDARRTTTATLAALKNHGVPTIGFVNERQLHVPGETDARIALLEQWVDAGMMLGNHTFSHHDLQRTPLQEYQDDVIHGEVVTRRLMSSRKPYQLYFRHPYTHTGPTKEIKEAFESFLRSRGYKIAPFTIENSDYIYNRIYVDASKQGDESLMKRLRTSYLDHTDAVFTFMEQLSRDTFGREINQILLIHANDLNADCMDEMLRRLRARRFSFITLDRAMEDKAYETRDDYVGAIGPSWVHRWRVGLGQPSRLKEEPDPPGWVLEMYRTSMSTRTR